MSQHINLTQGMVALVDRDDFDRLSVHKWCVSSATYSGRDYHKRYAQRRESNRIVLMHREITNAPRGMVVDHVNGDTLDNRKENLRVCTASENLYNRSKTRANKSGFKGVSFDKPRQCWKATIGVNGKDKFLGRYASPELAAEAYAAAALKYHGAFSSVSHTASCERCTNASARSDGLCDDCYAIITTDPQYAATPAELMEDHFRREAVAA